MNYWKNQRKIAFLCCISRNLLLSKSVGKSSILLISPKLCFVFELHSLKMLLFLDEFHVSIFFWQANDSRCNGGVWFSSNKSHSSYTSNHLPSRKNVDMEFIYFLSNFSFVIRINSHLEKFLWLVSQIWKVMSKGEHLYAYNIVIQDVKLMI